MSGILGALLGAPLRALKDVGTGFRLAGKLGGDKGSLATLKGVADTVTHYPGAVAGKVADYTSKTFNKGLFRGLGRLALDAPGGVALGASNAAGAGIRVALGVPLAALAFGTRVAGRVAHGIGKAGGYDLAKLGAKATAQGAWWTAKTGAKGVALEGLKAANLAGMVGKGIWKMRNNRSAQTLAFVGIAGGATAFGAMKGERNAFAGQMLPYDEFQSTFTNPQTIHNPGYAGVPGEQGLRHKIDDFGADGNLVFAMNNLRKTGMF